MGCVLFGSKDNQPGYVAPASSRHGRVNQQLGRLGGVLGSKSRSCSARFGIYRDSTVSVTDSGILGCSKSAQTMTKMLLN
jgi:hypothetical protein